MMDRLSKEEIKKFFHAGYSPEYIFLDGDLSEEFEKVDPKSLRDATVEIFRENDKIFGLT
jgi:hypothetical protein